MRARRPHWFLQATARVLAVLIGTVALAPVAWASLSQAYTATSSIAIGSLVSLDAKATGAVVVADNTNTDRLFG
ncbi:MAG TPA: hypothetical protein VLF67_01240, partial [Candidatus Saccharimonas sp.]|nr:hypothetical protein [Candidatus Saccharimonas sp.]